MTVLTLDTHAVLLESAPETLAGLVAAFDARLAPHGRILTGLRIDGVDEPAFRDPGLLARHLSDVQAIEALSGTERDLALCCLGDVASALTTLADATRFVALVFRGHDIARANRDLAEITQSIATAVAVTSAAGLGLRSSAGAQDATLARTVEAMGVHLEAAIAAQAAADWIALADTLEYDLVPSLDAWRDACAKTC